MIYGSATDELVAESERLRGEMLRTAARVQMLSEGLTAEAQRLRGEITSGEGEGDGGGEHA